MELIDGRKCAEYLKKNIFEKINSIKGKLKLVVIRVGNEASSIIYINNKKKACNEAKIDFEEIVFNSDIEETQLISKIKELNNDDSVTSILVQLPIPNHLNKHKIINTIDYKKDVDGLTDINKIKLINNEKCIIPCTARGIMKLFNFYNVSLEGKNVVLIGRSELVGKPLFNLLLKENATVTVCHSKTENLKLHTLNADIIICAVGKPNFIKNDMIKDESIIIDVGINRVNDKICGDVDFDDVKSKVSYISPVPGGVGLMTVASVLNNIIECYKLSQL